MQEITFVITDKNGMHARPAGAVVNCAKKYKSDINIYKGEKEANAKRLLSLMGLGATCGSTLVVRATGEDEREAISDIEKTLTRTLSEG